MPKHLRNVAIARLSASALVLFALGLTLTDNSGLVPERIVDLLGYYTLQANVIALIAWIGSTIAASRPTSERVDRALEYARAFTAANLVMVAIIYWTMIAPLGLQAGPVLVTVMIISHVITPVFASIDYLVVGNRHPLPLRGWWWFFALPTTWIATAVVRAYAGGWIPYDYLDPARGMTAIVRTVAWHGLLLAALSIAALRVRALRNIPQAFKPVVIAEPAALLDADRAVA